MTSFKEFLEEQLLDKEFAEHYDEVSAEMDLAFALVTRREELNMTQQELADLTGIKQPMIARIEGGQMPSPKTLQRLAKGLRIGVLFTGDGIMVVPRAGSRGVAQISPRQHESSYQVNCKTMTYTRWRNLSAVPNKRSKSDFNYSPFGATVETNMIAQAPGQKEKPNAGVEFVA